MSNYFYFDLCDKSIRIITKKKLIKTFNINTNHPLTRKYIHIIDNIEN